MVLLFFTSTRFQRLKAFFWAPPQTFLNRRILKTTLDNLYKIQVNFAKYDVNSIVDNVDKLYHNQQFAFLKKTTCIYQILHYTAGYKHNMNGCFCWRNRAHLLRARRITLHPLTLHIIFIQLTFQKYGSNWSSIKEISMILMFMIITRDKTLLNIQIINYRRID